MKKIKEEEENEIDYTYQDINSILYADQRVLNFGSYLPGGKLLGSSLHISNLSNFEQIIELSID